MSDYSVVSGVNNIQFQNKANVTVVFSSSTKSASITNDDNK